jgi:head-tail adaptor
MGYSAGILRWRVAIMKKKDPGDRAFGAKTEYEQVACVHANMTWKKGQKSLNEGALDSIDTVMFRMRWNNIVDRDCLLECDGVTYQIQSLHADRYDNTLLITATEIVK